jgi:hypothetical protein
MKQCKAMFWPQGNWHQKHCTKLEWKDGFCKIHHPDSVAERQKKSDERYRAKMDNSPITKLVKSNEKLKAINADLLEACLAWKFYLKECDNKIAPDYAYQRVLKDKASELNKKAISKAEGE